MEQRVLQMKLDEETYWDFCRFKLESKSRSSADALAQLLKLANKETVTFVFDEEEA